MKAIYSYKILDRFWKERTSDFFKLAKTSVEYASKLYPTKLYTDSASKKVFDEHGVKFDEYFINDEIFEDVNEHTYGLSKFKIFLNEDSQYVQMDLDTVLLQAVNTKHAVTYGYREIDFRGAFYDSLENLKPNPEEKQIHMDYVEKYYWKYFMMMDKKFTDKKLIHFSNTYPSNSLMVVNNPSLIKEAAKNVLDLIEGDYRKYTVQFYEQYLLYALLKNYNAKIGFMYRKLPIIDLTKEYELGSILSYKFLHLDNYDRDGNIMKLVDKLYDNLDTNSETKKFL